MLTMSQQQFKRLLPACCLVGMWCIASGVSAQAPSTASKLDPDGVSAAAAKVMRADLQTRSDSELTELTARWGELSAPERRALLAEVRTRMDRSQTPAAAGLRQRIRITRQYGQVKRDRLAGAGVVRKTLRIRQPDGSVVVRTEVVQVAPEGPDGQTNVKRTITFGTGYERRAQRSGRTANPVRNAPPVTTVSEREPDQQAE